MSFDPLVTIILLIYFIAVLGVLIIWFALTLGSRISWPLNKVQQSAKNVQTKARVKIKPTSLPVKAEQSRAESSNDFNSYRHKRRRASLQERNFRIFSRGASLPDNSRSKKPLVANRLSEQANKDQDHNNSYTTSIDSKKNFSNPSKSLQKLSNNQFRGEGAKKQRSSISLNFDEDFLKDFAKNKK